MEFLRNVFLFLHFVGLAVLLGSVVAQIGQERLRVTAGMLHGALLQLVSGIGVMFTRIRLHDDDPEKWAELDETKLTVKLVVLLVIIGIVLVTRRKEKAGAAYGAGPWAAVGVLTLVNIGLAVFWT